MKNRHWLAAFLVTIAGASALSAQGTRPASDAAPLDQLLQEVRGLRAELAQASAASIRAQILVGRIQLQEQRIHTLSAQLSDVRRRLSTGESSLTMPAGALKHLEDAMRGNPANNAAAAEPNQAPAFDPLVFLRAQLEQGQVELQSLRQEEAALTQQLAVEQGRWTEFNAQLDALEREISAAARR
jgi:hypothetical protein